jgi:formylglycine-generating enzyme required for sulfatase activity
MKKVLGRSITVLLVAGIVWPGFWATRIRVGAQAADAVKRPATRFAGAQAGETRDDNGLKLKLVWIPPGKFTMGSPPNEWGRENWENQVKITLTQGFWFGQTEVTEGEWRRVIETSPWKGKYGVIEGVDYPATFVSWDDAMKFCEKLTAQEQSVGRLPSGWKYTLPTEAQWEYACRAGTATRFSFGNDDLKLSDYAWWGGFIGEGSAKNEGYAHLVGQKQANPWGLKDMHGNVWELCRDWHASTLAEGTDPEGPSQGTFRVVRGGSWGATANDCRSAVRQGLKPQGRNGNTGFRVAIVPAGK